MKLATIVSDSNQIVCIDGDAAYPLPQNGDWPTTMKELIANFDDWSDRILQLKQNPDSQKVDRNGLTLDAPIRDCQKLLCIGKNYAQHATEMGGQVPEMPIVFNKFASALNRPGGDVVLPAISERVDFEAELVVVIGKSGRNISRERALDHVFGYCCGNDISARDWQKSTPAGQWLLGKTFDSFAPLGPYIVTSDEVQNPHKLGIQLRLNGETMQKSNTRQFIFSIDVLISHISQFVTLQPGDLIFTGTPAGVGAGRKPPVFLQSGDRLEVEIDGLGVLSNPVVRHR